MLPCYIVDAFVGPLFSGNPAAVVILEKEVEAEWMQKVAAEFNLSETSFLVPAGNNAWQLRWFTPTTEVNLCGHATLAAAHVLVNELDSSVEQITFHTRSGELIATRSGDQLILDFPRTYTEPSPEHRQITSQLGLLHFPVFKAGEDMLIEFPTAHQVQAYQPDMNAVAALKCRGLIVTARGANEGLDFVSRFFAPAFGIPEDPVTGSAHCALADYWSRQLNKTQFMAEQLSERRGYLFVELLGARVALSGKCRTMVRGELDAGI